MRSLNAIIMGRYQIKCALCTTWGDWRIKCGIAGVCAARGRVEHPAYENVECVRNADHRGHNGGVTGVIDRREYADYVVRDEVFASGQRESIGTVVRLELRQQEWAQATFHEPRFEAAGSN